MSEGKELWMSSGNKEFRTRMGELGPIIYYRAIYENVQLCVLSKRPDDKVYAYCEAMMGTGFFELIICITDRCIDCSYVDADSPDDISKCGKWSEKILDAVLRLGARLDWYGKYYMEKWNGNWPMKMELDESLTTGFIESYIPSIDTAAYLRSIDHHFSELEKAAIIENHQCFSMKEKRKALKRLKKLSKDEKLRERLEQGGFHDFFVIPHDFRHGDIVRFVGKKCCKMLGVILGYDEKAYKLYCKTSGDYSDIQITVDTRFLIDGYDRDCRPIFEYLGEFSHQHMNPIYIERARLAHDDMCGLYLEYLAACGTSKERKKQMLAQEMVVRQLEYVWLFYPKMTLTELTIAAAKTAKLWRDHPQIPIKELICLPEADDFDISKVKDFEIMDGLFHMLPQSVKKRYLEQGEVKSI